MANLDTLKVVDAIQSYDTKRLVPVLDGPDQSSFIPFYPQSLSTSSLTFVVNPPSLDTGVDRRVLYRIAGTATLNFTMQSTTANPAAIDGTNLFTVGLSESPLDQITATESANFANKQNSVQRSLVGVELNRLYNKSGYDAGFASGTSSGMMKDFAAYFEPFLDTNRDPLATYSDVPESDQVATPRTNWLRITSAPNVTLGIAGTAVAGTIGVAFDFYAFSAVSPFSSSEHDRPAIRGLNSIIFQLQFLSNLNAMFSVAYQPYTSGANVPYTATYTGATNFVFSSDTALWMRFITPSKYSVMENKPSENVVSYREIQNWQSASIAVPANGSQVSVSIQQISSSVIPSLIILAVRDVQSALPFVGANVPRTWYPVSNGGVNLKFLNQTFLNGANQRQLYEMSVRNGLCQMPYEQWIARDMTQKQLTGYNKSATSSLILGGGFMVLNPAKDCQIVREGVTNGTIANWTLTGSLQLAPNYKVVDSTMVELCVIAVYEGFCRFDLAGGVNAETGLLTKEQTLSVLMDNRQPVVDTILPVNRGGSVLKYIEPAYGAIKKLVEVGLKNKDALKKIYSDYKGKGEGLHRKLHRGRGYDDDSEDENSGGAILDTSSYAIQTKKDISKRYL